MSTHTEHDVETEAPVRAFLVREFAAELTPGDGRTVDVRIVPYGVPAEVSDNGGRNMYREQWDDNCFDDQLVAGHRLKVLLNFEHLTGISNVVGKGVALRSIPGDGLHGSFRMDDDAAGNKALELVKDGILDSVSLEAYPKKSVRTAEGVVKRVKAHLHNVALCRKPAFADARVLAVREEPHQIIDEELLPFDLDTELVERCRRAGIRLPQRYKEQPVDTPTDVGTPDNGTLQDPANTSLEEQL